MQRLISARIMLAIILMLWLILSISCDQPGGNSNLRSANTNANSSNSLPNSNINTNSNIAAVDPNSTISETKEPDQYQAIVQLKLEATGEKSATMPTVSANVARSGADRRMEFNMPNGDKLVYLDKAGTTYLLLPNRKQYAILDKESLGFEV